MASFQTYSRYSSIALELFYSAPEDTSGQSSALMFETKNIPYTQTHAQRIFGELPFILGNIVVIADTREDA